jgi:hypothetical protein
MSHSLMNADRGTHCKIVAVALVAAIAVVLVGINARVSRTDVSSVVVKAGKPTISATLNTTATR